MRQGDQDWWRLADTISTEDHPRAVEHNAHAPPQHRLELALGPVPCAGAIMTAPVVVLLSHPALDAQSTPDDYSFRRAGWPLAALHPEAPRGISVWWRGFRRNWCLVATTDIRFKVWCNRPCADARMRGAGAQGCDTIAG